jgi:outer membrane murein-binding lipoprotein Lpp
MHELRHLIRIGALLGVFSMAGCSSVNVVVDAASIRNQARFDRDSTQCSELAESYDLNEDKVANSVVGAGSGALTTVGLASAVVGSLYVPSMPFMVAGTLGGGGMGVGWSSYKENAAQEKILTQCLNRKGYRAYSAQ